MAANAEIRRAADRAVTTTPWLQSRHSFSFGDHYDPRNTHHGLLLVNNDDIVEPGTGFETHAHRDMEIVTWVLRGELTHRDSAGNHGVIYPGLAQRMSAGSGILHSEKNQSATDAVHFVQMWVIPEVAGIAPGYQQREIGDEALAGELVPVASGMPGHDAVIGLHNRQAALHATRLKPGDAVPLPRAPFVHVFAARGHVALEEIGELHEGDAVRFADSDGRRVTAVEPAELLVWEMHAALGG
ncbi:putative quercetin 2,3-dioxygenase [Mycobacterium saskatchewanense]|uniref:Quercetin 2,3-dioxygenase n=1 Tax=Mycobacterium saskatchewanense TaxID=220927 RepID=A0A1X2CDA5_9MYCO|nr:pirin-like bicupin family protein [Mycobacterium saskatchewanense]ORW73880.1 quercetin 2,3-dioxygenase [Mycobacterium saskatchewanense]BBX64565.1 putative quercetin 2,3-dioxygenase [Mycobacterium saskatchewanense]